MCYKICKIRRGISSTFHWSYYYWKFIIKTTRFCSRYIVNFQKLIIVSDLKRIWQFWTNLYNIKIRLIFYSNLNSSIPEKGYTKGMLVFFRVYKTSLLLAIILCFLWSKIFVQPTRICCKYILKGRLNVSSEFWWCNSLFYVWKNKGLRTMVLYTLFSS